MALDLKGLKKLVALCRAQGIKHYKCADFEFTLTDEAPAHVERVSNQSAQPANSATSPVTAQDIKIASEGLTEEQLLFYSVVEAPGGQTQQEQPNG